jgi:AraC family transcriptional regulator, transcriptional activator of pobA
LYGEHSAAFAQSDALHIESIQSRSCKYLWKIETHRHTLLSQLVFVADGPVEAHLDDCTYALRGRAAIVIPAGTIHSFQFSPETQGCVLTVDLARLLTAAGAGHHVPLQVLFSSARAFDLGSEESLGQRIAQLLQALELEFKQPDSLFMPMCSWLACCALSVLAHGAAGHRLAERQEGTALEALRRFRALIEMRYLEHWPTQRFAQHLGLSETGLNRVCRRLTGITAFELIQQRIALEARRKLVYSANSVSSIAAELGFKDPAYFCRFFRRRSGASPHSFRRTHGVR